MFRLIALISCLALGACSATIPRKNPVGEMFPVVTGNSLDGKPFTFPEDVKGQNVLLLVGFVHKSQFDIDRWLIGIDQKRYKATVFEIPTLKGWGPRMVAGMIDESMRSGIPQELWKIVVTVYKDAEKIVSLTGNEDPGNARVIVLDANGRIKVFHDRGFSVSALNQLSPYFPSELGSDCK